MLILLFAFFALFAHADDAFETVPAAYLGRFRPVDAYARLWHYEHGQGAYSLDHLWQLHFQEEETEEYEKRLAELMRLPFTKEDIEDFPLKKRLATAGNSFYLLPDRHDPSVWYSLKALKLKIFDPASQTLVPVSNFSAYPDDVFEEIRKSYLERDRDSLGRALQKAYEPLAGKPYKEAHGKRLYFPTMWQLTVEHLYYKWPLITICLFLYALAACFFAYPRLLFGFVALAFCLHTIILSMRSFILMRPPVSNMFETVLYVPWVATLAALFFSKKRWGLIAASITSVALLALLKVTAWNSSMENVQAVLDSQYWLIIHVLMVVGSYGLFLLSGILGHLYLIRGFRERQETKEMRELANALLYAMYVGVALLIPGTILGGVWAAESWGRFWDWDPKESWAFISCCTYLLFIHAYRFGYIQNRGLSFGSIIGLQAIIFTWYGVNYILGTGLHSYGFGSGGEMYYALFLGCEALFLTTVSFGRAVMQRYLIVFLFFLPFYGEGAQGYSKPKDISEAVWETVKPYLLPSNHPVKTKLDQLFGSLPYITEKKLKGAHFKNYKQRPQSKMVVSPHKAIPGYLVKLFTDDENSVDYVNMIHRIKGAQSIKRTIERHGFQRFFKVPKKWIYLLPYKHKHHFVLVVEDMKILSRKQNYRKWKGSEMTKELAKAIFIVLKENGLHDTIHPFNLPFCYDGKLAFIDTEYHHSSLVHFEKMTRHLPPRLHQFWLKLIENEPR